MNRLVIFHSYIGVYQRVLLLFGFQQGDIWEKNNLIGPKKICLVVWNILSFPYIGNVIIPIDELHHFSEGFFLNHQAVKHGKQQLISPSCRDLPRISNFERLGWTRSTDEDFDLYWASVHNVKSSDLQKPSCKNTLWSSERYKSLDMYNYVIT